MSVISFSEMQIDNLISIALVSRDKDSKYNATEEIRRRLKEHKKLKDNLSNKQTIEAICFAYECAFGDGLTNRHDKKNAYKKDTPKWYAREYGWEQGQIKFVEQELNNQRLHDEPNLPMSKECAIDVMKTGKKLTHRLFTPAEWVTFKNGNYVFEDGRVVTPKMFWDTRYHEVWDEGWKLFE